MNRKTFFPFFLIILVSLVVFTLGCGSMGSGDGLSEQTSAAKFSKGIFNTTIHINGAEKTDLTLTSRQPAEVGVTIKNQGPDDINNLNIRAIGCVDVEQSPAVENLQKGTTNYLSWTIRAPELGSSENFGCPLILRACFEETSNGYIEVTALPEDYSEVPSAPNYYYKSGIFATEPNFGTIRTISEPNGGAFIPDDNVFYGTLKINNIGSGWVDYIGQSAESELGIYKINKINMSLSPDSKLAFYKIGDSLTNDISVKYAAPGVQLTKNVSTSSTAIEGGATTDKPNGLTVNDIKNEATQSDTYGCASGLTFAGETDSDGHIKKLADGTYSESYNYWRHGNSYLYVPYVTSAISDIPDGFIESDLMNPVVKFYCTGPVTYTTGKGISLESGKLGDNEYLLKMIGGEELDLRLALKATTAYSTLTYETIDYSINSGYCIDLASINVQLTGR